MKKEMLINVRQPEESRLAILEGGVLEELYVERTSHENLVGNIYKGRIVNIEPSIQAAFVDFGIGRNGFLHVSDVDSQYYTHLVDEVDNDRPDADFGDSKRPNSRGPRLKPPIQDIFKRNQEVLVQVIKEAVGTKGPTLTTYISIPGRFLVLMPGLNRVGVSRKIEDDQQRRELRETLKELNPPKGLGFIVRTAGAGRSKRDLSRDLAYLSRLWKVVVRRINKMKAPAEIYLESDMIIRTIRDIFAGDVDVLWVDHGEAYEQAREFFSVTMPRYANRLKLYQGHKPLFHKFRIEDEIAKIQQRRLPLPNGGSIVIDQTEALVAIDVNSGNFRADNNAEETAYRINLTAAKEIARQLRLRDLGGVVVCDFIDMREERHRRDVEQTIREAVRRDRARTKVLRMSAFGLIEMTRQRIRPSLKRSIYQDCAYCSGGGQVKTPESVCIEVMRLLQLAAYCPSVSTVEVDVHSDVAVFLNNAKRRELTEIEQTTDTFVTVRGVDNVSPEYLVFRSFDSSRAELLDWQNYPEHAIELKTTEQGDATEETPETKDESTQTANSKEGAPAAKKKSRGRRRRKSSGPKRAEQEAGKAAQSVAPSEADAKPKEASDTSAQNRDQKAPSQNEKRNNPNSKTTSAKDQEKEMAAGDDKPPSRRRGKKKRRPRKKAAGKKADDLAESKPVDHNAELSTGQNEPE